jgi:hypothetical protein
VYIQAKAEELTDVMEIAHASAILYQRKGKDPRRVVEFTGESSRRIYKAVLEKAWVNLDVDAKNDFIDTRREVTLV